MKKKMYLKLEESYVMDQEVKVTKKEAKVKLLDYSWNRDLW